MGKEDAVGSGLNLEVTENCDRLRQDYPEIRTKSGGNLCQHDLVVCTRKTLAELREDYSSINNSTIAFRKFQQINFFEITAHLGKHLACHTFSYPDLF